MAVTISQRDVLFSTSSPQNRSSAHKTFIVSAVWGRLDNGFSSFSAARRAFSKSVFQPCFPKSLAEKTLLRLSTSPLRLSAPGKGGGEGGVGREAKNVFFVLKTLNRIEVFFLATGSWVFLVYPGCSACFCCFCLVSWFLQGFPGFSACFCCFCLVSWVP